MSGRMTPAAFTGADIPSDDVLTNCMHCALCLPTCPTYAITGLERSSPRGRIRLIKAVAEGTLPITDSFVDEMNFCLDCQACETACPAGVKYGSLVEAARAQIYRGGHESFLSTTIKRIFMRWTFARQPRLKFAARLLRIYQTWGIQTVLEWSGLLRLVSRKLAAIQPLSPAVSRRFTTDEYAGLVPAHGRAEHRVAFLTGCLMDVAFADVNTDTIELLRHHGCDVVIPRGQACCGSLQAHNGDMDGARDFARRIIPLFAGLNVDAIVMNSAGCGAYMKEYAHIFADDPALRDAAAGVSSKVKDITEYLCEIGFHPARMNGNGPYAGKRVTYHDACHLAHTQKITEAPRQLIRSVPGVAFQELPESAWCCGSAGIYNVVRYDDSMKILDRKLANIRTADPEIIVTGNPGCLLQIRYGLKQQGMNVELLHTATFLRRACGI